MATDDLKKNHMMAYLLDGLEHNKDIGHDGRLMFTVVGRHFVTENEWVKELAKDSDEGNVYRDLEFPQQVYDHIREYRQHKTK